MNINELVKKCHQNAIDKGFYECPTCEGKGNAYHDETGIETCPDCRGSGIDRDRNISELLMLIVSELGEAQEALRNRLFSDLKTYKNCVNADDLLDSDKMEYIIMQFESLIKDTFEDELADTFIRLFDLCGYLHIDIEKHILAKMEYNKTRPKKHNKAF